MSFWTDGVVPWNSLDDNTRAPLSSELETGYPCGEADQKLFNWTAGYSIGQVWNVIASSGITPDKAKLLDLSRAIQSQKLNYGVAGGTGSALTLALPQAPAAYVAGLVVRAKITATNPGAATLNVNGLGAKSIVTLSGDPIPGGSLPVGAIAEFRYDGAAFQLAVLDIFGNENLILNPLFRINQDGFAGGAVSGGSYAIDMWGAPTGVASNYTFANGVATIVSGKLRQVIEDPGTALGDVTLQWQGTSQCSVNGGAAQSSPITISHASGAITVDAGVGAFSRPMMAVGAKPSPFRAPSIPVDRLNCYRHYYVNTDQLDQYVPTALGSNQAWALRYYLTFPTAMRNRPAITLLAYELTDRASGIPSPRSDFSGFTLRVDVNAGNGVAAVSNLRFKADARIAL